VTRLSNQLNESPVKSVFMLVLISLSNVGLLRVEWICGGTAMRSSVSRDMIAEGTWSRKMRFSLLSKFYLNRPRMRANVFYSRCRKDLNGAIA